jgi:hypothetical protein
MNMKYQVTKKQCQVKIDDLKNVCDRCGRKIVPLKTVNNSGEPTYWAGCMHGQTKKGAWGHFTSGVKKEIYDLAVKLVSEDSMDFGMTYNDKDLGDFTYAWQNAVSRACKKVEHIEWIKTNNPRYTKKQLKEQFAKELKHK